MAARTIDEVIGALSEEIARARNADDRIGYFAALYRRVTLAVKDGIANGAFEDGPRMARLDVSFANRYLDALVGFRKSEPVSRCWRVAFEATEQRRPIILQHLLLGMNAHINLDLGIAAAEAAPGAALPSLRNDFYQINQILASLVDRVQDELDALSPALALLDSIGGRTDEQVVNFSIQRARDAAWTFASHLAGRAPADWAEVIAARDRETTMISQCIATPRPLVSLGLLWIRARESWDVRHNIDELAAK